MPLHRHQSSLEGVLDFSPSFSFTLQQRQIASDLFSTLIDHFHLEPPSQRGYDPNALIQATFEHVASKDAFLLVFFSFIYGVLYSTEDDAVESDITLYLASFNDFIAWDPDRLSKAKSAIEGFAEYIFDNFLLPLKASSIKTPQHTPTSLSSIQTLTPTGTAQRLSVLRQKCLVRDHHRCVISRKFDTNEARKRSDQHGKNCRDDDGYLLSNESSDRFQFLEVAHILPHSLTTISPGNNDVSDSKKNALRILDMFDPGIIYLVDGPKIDSPMNALTLTYDYHRLFSEFQIYFEPTGIPYQYQIYTMEERPFLRDPLFPVTRTLTLSPNRTIDPPSARLLSIHRAIAHILKLSGAGEYIDNILRDVEEARVKEDGSTYLSHLLKLRLGGWIDTLTVF